MTVFNHFESPISIEIDGERYRIPGGGEVHLPIRPGKYTARIRYLKKNGKPRYYRFEYSPQNSKGHYRHTDITDHVDHHFRLRKWGLFDYQCNLTAEVELKVGRAAKLGVSFEEYEMFAQVWNRGYRSRPLRLCLDGGEILSRKDGWPEDAYPLARRSHTVGLWIMYALGLILPAVPVIPLALLMKWHFILLLPVVAIAMLPDTLRHHKEHCHFQRIPRLEDPCSIHKGDFQ